MQLQLMADFSIQSAGDRVFHGMTVNMSRSGVLIESFDSECPVQTGDLAYVEIHLPALHSLQQRCMACSGTVVRVECEEKSRRFAISIDALHFQDAGLRAIVREYATAFVM